MGKLKPAYSLIELTVIVGLTGLLALSITTISLSSLLSSKRLRTASKLHQLGNSILTQLAYLIRNAVTISSCNSTSNNLDLVSQDSFTTTLSFNSSTSQIASSSSSITYNLNPPEFPINSFSITCLPNDLNPHLIRISFTLSNSTSITGPYNKVEIPFSTDIEIRNQ